MNLVEFFIKNGFNFTECVKKSINVFATVPKDGVYIIDRLAENVIFNEIETDILTEKEWRQSKYRGKFTRVDNVDTLLVRNTISGVLSEVPLNILSKSYLIKSGKRVSVDIASFSDALSRSRNGWLELEIPCLDNTNWLFMFVPDTYDLDCFQEITLRDIKFNGNFLCIDNNNLGINLESLNSMLFEDDIKDFVNRDIIEFKSGIDIFSKYDVRSFTKFRCSYIPLEIIYENKVEVLDLDNMKLLHKIKKCLNDSSDFSSLAFNSKFYISGDSYCVSINDTKIDILNGTLENGFSIDFTDCSTSMSIDVQLVKDLMQRYMQYFSIVSSDFDNNFTMPVLDFDDSKILHGISDDYLKSLDLNLLHDINIYTRLNNIVNSCKVNNSFILFKGIDFKSIESKRVGHSIDITSLSSFYLDVNSALEDENCLIVVRNISNECKVFRYSENSVLVGSGHKLKIEQIQSGVGYTANVLVCSLVYDYTPSSNQVYVKDSKYSVQDISSSIFDYFLHNFGRFILIDFNFLVNDKINDVLDDICVIDLNNVANGVLLNINSSVGLIMNILVVEYDNMFCVLLYNSTGVLLRKSFNALNDLEFLAGDLGKYLIGYTESEFDFRSIVYYILLFSLKNSMINDGMIIDSCNFDTLSCTSCLSFSVDNNSYQLNISIISNDELVIEYVGEEVCKYNLDSVNIIDDILVDIYAIFGINPYNRADRIICLFSSLIDLNYNRCNNNEFDFCMFLVNCMFKDNSFYFSIDNSDYCISPFGEDIYLAATNLYKLYKTI